MAISPIDTIAFTQKLIQCPSITPIEAGAVSLMEDTLRGLGFACHRLRFEEDGFEPVDNLYARFGTGAPNFCFAGHTDVVPVGDASAWSVEPFSATITPDNRMIGRGAVDMKGGIGAMVGAVSKFLSARGGTIAGSISFLITNDEESVAVNGTQKVLQWMRVNDEKIDACLVGEPTNPHAMGDMIKIGRRGTLTGYLSVAGKQGHVAYPHNADNPISKLLPLLSALEALHLDDGNAHFQPSNLEITNIHVGNMADNVIPAAARATFNVRFNDIYSGKTLEALIRKTLDAARIPYDLKMSLGGESFLTPAGKLSEITAAAVHSVTNRMPDLSTTGGTSDARFIRDHCPVIECGLINTTAHQVDEHTTVSDLQTLEAIYLNVLERYFAG